MAKHRKGPPTLELAEEYTAGATSTDLAAKYHMTHAAVCRRLSRAGVQLRDAKRRSPADSEPICEEVIRLYRSGLSMDDIVKSLGMKRKRSTIQRILVRAGVPIRRNGTRSPTITIPNDPLKLGYLAGLFDGEGNLQFKTTRRNRGNDSTGCKVAIYGTVPATMGWLKTNIGGSVRWDYKRQERKGWLPCGSWEIYRAQDVLAFLRAVEPLLLAKKNQAVRAIKFLSHKCHHDSPPTITQ